MKLVTTGQAASILGSSRQHVVDLCDSGQLGYSSVGTHRRVRLIDLLRLKEGEKTAGKLTRDQVRSLWLHQPVARRLVTDPERTLRRARVNLRRLKAAHPAASRRAGWVSGRDSSMVLSMSCSRR